MDQGPEATQGACDGSATCDAASQLPKKGPLVQASGHGDSFHVPEDRPDCVLKPCCPAEQRTLQELMDTPELLPYVPRYHGLQRHQERSSEAAAAQGGAAKGDAEGITAEAAAGGAKEDFLIIQNLVHGMADPVVMDIKMGTRTFELAEVQSEQLPRADLMQKMLATDPDAPTAEEREAGGITKLRYMQFRETRCTTARLGFRIEAINNGQPGRCVTKEACKSISDKAQVRAALATFMGGGRGGEAVGRPMLLRLRELRAALGASAWFRSHELVGSSLLFVYDQAETAEGGGPCGAGVWMIDFAHTHASATSLSHLSPWGGEGTSSEDGYLTGLDNLISIWESLLQ